MHSEDEDKNIELLVENHLKTGEISPQEAEEIKQEIKTNPLPDIAKEGGDKASNDIRTLIGKMKIPQKMKCAMFGNGTCRMLLISDPNKLIQMSVLKNPKMQPTEVEDFAKNKNLSGEVLRFIGDSALCSSSYTIKKNLVNNPKTPLEISMKWLKFLQKADIKNVARSRGLPSALVTIAKKLTEQKAEH